MLTNNTKPALIKLATTAVPHRATFPLNKTPPAAAWIIDASGRGAFLYNGNEVTFILVARYNAEGSCWLAEREDGFSLAFSWYRTEDAEYMNRRLAEIDSNCMFEPWSVGDGTIFCPVRANSRIALFARSHVTNQTQLFDRPLTVEQLHSGDVLLIEFQFKRSPVVAHTIVRRACRVCRLTNV